MKNSTISADIQQFELIIDNENSRYSRYNFSEPNIDGFRKLLNHFSEDDFMNCEWVVAVASSRRQTTLSFSKGLSVTDTIILKALVLEYLTTCASISSIKHVIYNATTFFLFLQERNLFIENCRSGIINLYVSYLDTKLELSVSQKNSLIRTVASLMEICSSYGLLSGTGVIDCSHRWKEQKIPKRAPDYCVVTALDTLFFDFTNQTIPNSYRCLYLLVRLIPNRISEVISMDVECLTYPDIDVYSISIPTAKETPYHMPRYIKYNRKLSGWGEGLLYKTICRQRAYALQMQSELTDFDKGYLFVSPKHNKLISKDEFNDFLEHICVSNNILDAVGNQAHVTSHDFRHVAIGERLRGNIISPIQTMIEGNHSSLEQTLGYGYQSYNDEATHLGKITCEVFKTKWNILNNEEKKVEPYIISEQKYCSLEKQPFTRLIPGYGICCEVSCISRYMLCFQCEHFKPDELYNEYFENAIIILEEKIILLHKKRSSEEAIAFNQKQLELFRLFICKIEKSKQQNTA